MTWDNTSQHAGMEKEWKILSYQIASALRVQSLGLVTISTASVLPSNSFYQ